jgi:hypothetical protein
MTGSLLTVEDPGGGTEAADLNPVIWVLWLQGFDQAPVVVRHCLRSWKTRNPGWVVVELDREKLSDYIDPESLSTILGLDLTYQKTANLIRLYLLSRYGGVWADAGSFCAQPLDEWLHGQMSSGFFAFRLSGDTWLRQRRSYQLFSRAPGAQDDRVLANWFLAARRGNPLVKILFEEHRDFFIRNRFPLQHVNPENRTRVLRFQRFLGRNPRLAQLWTSPLVVRFAKVYPYFIFHYHFAKVVRVDDRCREVWERTPVRFARIPPGNELFTPLTAERRLRLLEYPQPVYKLRWRASPARLPEGCVTDLLIRGLDE